MNSRNIGFGENAAPHSFKIFTTSYFGIPFPVFLFIFITFIFVIILRKIRLGRYIYAIGSNEEAARLAGLQVNLIRTAAFIFCGLLSGLAGIIHAAQLFQGNPNDGVGFELDAIAAVVIGGTSLQGGRGTLEGTFAGVLIIGLLSNILGLHGVQKDFQLMLKGAIIVVAVLLQERNWRSFLKR
jgi:ribose transport system permease protein